MARDSRSKVYVGDLANGTTKEELEDKFCRFGQLRSVWIARKPPGFAFVEFEDPRDADDAIKNLNGIRLNGRRLRVEMASGKRNNSGPRYGGGGGGGSYGGGDRSWGGGPSRGRPSYDDYRPQRRFRMTSDLCSLQDPDFPSSVLRAPPGFGLPHSRLHVVLSRYSPSLALRHSFADLLCPRPSCVP